MSDEDRTDKAAPSHRRDRSGNTPVAESATPDGYAYTGWPHPKGKAASISDAEIDALEFVVERGRIASQIDYGVLRSLLVRLRPEWLDRPEPVKDCDSDRPKPIAHTPPTHTTPGECSKPREGTSEPPDAANSGDDRRSVGGEALSPMSLPPSPEEDEEEEGPIWHSATNKPD